MANSDDLGMDLARMRQEYEETGIVEADFGDDPMPHFGDWLQDASRAELTEPNAMVLSTIDSDGNPSARFVLCKGISTGEVGRLGVEFYTNYNSDKGQQLAANHNASLTFGWLGLHRQLRMAGPIEKLSPEDSDKYFAKRPPKSQIGAIASNQSEVLNDRAQLEAAFEALAKELEDTPAQRPPHWGGYLLVPTMVEFWQGRRSRLHDRLRYRHTKEGWIKERLAP